MAAKKPVKKEAKKESKEVKKDVKKAVKLEGYEPMRDSLRGADALDKKKMSSIKVRG